MALLIESHTLDERRIFTKTAEKTNGELLEMEAFYHPVADWGGVPFHLHPQQDEHFEVLEGQLTVECNGVRRVYVAGEQFDVPRGTEHAMCNLGPTRTRVSWQVRPALQTQQFFETIFGLTDEGTLRQPLQFAVVARDYANVFQLTRQPLILRLAIPVLAWAGGLFGYRSHYSRHAARNLIETP